MDIVAAVDMEFKSFAKAIDELAVVSRPTVYRRVKEGWSIEDALAYPAHCKPGESKRPLVIGDKRGMLILLRKAKSRNYKNKVWYGMWDCVCLCGEVVTVMAASLRSGDTRSCGCLQKVRLSEFNTRTKTGVKRNVKQRNNCSALQC